MSNEVCRPTPGGRRGRACLWVTIVCLAAALGGPTRAWSAGPEDGDDSVVSQAAEPTFAIRAFAFEGNALFADAVLAEVLQGFTGEEMTAREVEGARAALERFYQENGFVRVMVNIPEQEVENGIVRLQVVETAVGEVRVVGNRHFSPAAILQQLPSLTSGEVIRLPDLEQEFSALLRNPDLKVKLNLVPGREPGTDDLELEVTDRLPLHGSLELNNRSSHDTTDLRLNASLHYDNLWQKGHSVGLQYQTAPQDLAEVQVVGASYVLPSPWNEKYSLAVYGVWSDSEVAFGDGFHNVADGMILGLRYVMPLPNSRNYYHSATLGVDYKDFRETFDLENGGTGETPITYLPFSVVYSGNRYDDRGQTLFSAAVNLAFRGAVTDPEEFDAKRTGAEGEGSGARGNFLYLLLKAERQQKLFAGTDLFLQLDGQVASEPLVSSEQYSAGGASSVRGYKESEALGDNALHGTAEWRLPELAPLLGLGEKARLRPYLFYDLAFLQVKKPLPSQDAEADLQGAGAGLRGALFGALEFQADWGIALADTGRTDSHDQQVHFRLKYQF